MTEKTYLCVFWGAVALIVILVSAMLYANYVRAHEDISNVAYRIKAQRLVPGEIACEQDPHEGCLVCLHQDMKGWITIASHC